MKPITKIQKRNDGILTEYEKMTNDGYPKMESYRVIGLKWGLSQGGVRYAIQCARVLRSKPGMQ